VVWYGQVFPVSYRGEETEERPKGGGDSFSDYSVLMTARKAREGIAGDI